MDLHEAAEVAKIVAAVAGTGVGVQAVRATYSGGRRVVRLAVGFHMRVVGAIERIEALPPVEDLLAQEAAILELKADVRAIKQELRPNGGASMRDAIERLEIQAAFNRARMELQYGEDVPGWSSSPEGACTHINHALEQLTGMSSEAALGWGWVSFISEGDRARVREEWLRAVRDLGRFDMRFRIRCTEGREYTVRGVAVPVMGGGGFQRQARLMGFLGWYPSVEPA